MFVNNLTQVYVPSMVFDANSNQFIWLTYPNYYQCQFVPNYGISLNNVPTNGVCYYSAQNYRVDGEEQHYNQDGIVEKRNTNVQGENIDRPTQNCNYQFNGHCRGNDQCCINSQTFYPNKTPQSDEDDEKKQRNPYLNENRNFTNGTCGTFSRGESNKENNPPTSSLQERQSRTRCDDGSPDTDGAAGHQREQAAAYISRQLSQLHLPDRDLARHLRNYTLSPQQLLQLGFPVESSQCPGGAIIYKESHPPRHTQPRHSDISESDCNTVKRLPDRAEERRCVRCSKVFFVSHTGEYLSTEQCLYHWGKLLPYKEYPQSYSCCKGKPNARGCRVGKLHVWSGVGVGVNGPLEGFVRTLPRRTPPPDGSLGVYALDCEMCYTKLGLELSRVTVVAPDGRLVYDTVVRPEREIIAYNSRFSGISARDYDSPDNYKSLGEVQNDLLGFIDADTILIGHGLDNDLRALKMIHTACVDTSVIFPHHLGLPYRRSLKSLAAYFLRTAIQTDPQGHDSCEDARTCIALMLYRIEKDFREAFSA